MKDQIEFQGIVYTRYPQAKGYSARNYYQASRKDRRNGKTYLHRDVWISINGEIPPKMHIHHKDENTLNNSIENLVCLSLSNHRKEHYCFDKISGYAKKAWKEWKKTKSICTCCGKSYEVFRRSQSRFCSDNCVTKARWQSGIDNIEKECIECKKIFTCNKYKQRHTCSRVCADILSSKTKAARRLL